MTFWEVVLAVVVGNVITGLVGITLTWMSTWNIWNHKNRGSYSYHDGRTAKQVQMAWDAMMGDEEPEEPEPEELDFDSDYRCEEEDAESYLGWAGTENYEEPHDCLLEGCLDNENEEPCPNA